MWGSKKRTRRPHPDPARELELRRILDLRASIDRRADLAIQYRKEINYLHSQAGQSRPTGAKVYTDQARVMHQQIMEIEESITRTHEDIAALQAKLSPDDLAFLELGD